jgi:uncharacterized phiE125 gp8 family phage protein
MTVPLSTIKSALKIDYDDDDADLTRLREAAITFVERRTAVRLAPTACTLYVSSWTDSVIPETPFSAITSVAYTDTSAASQTMPASDYWIDRTDGPMPVLRFLEAPALGEGTAITVTYTAGYSAVPSDLTHCVIAIVGAWYNNPEAFQPIGLSTVPMSVEMILEMASARTAIR